MIALTCFMLALYEAAAVVDIVQPYTEEIDIEVFWARASRDRVDGQDRASDPMIRRA
jgi:hypothetical protein